jgi:3-hydroxyisobutyrate dehydrogenase-like beta-hydroxyacid dehydrogenase
MNLAFIGLGRMGSAMARNLLRAGHRVTVYNRTRSKAEALAREDATVAGSPAEAARDCDAVITMLADDQAVMDAVFGSNGLMAALASGAVHISCSTISTKLGRHLTREHGSRGQKYLSAPVFGRPDAAEAKKLVVVPAGPPDVVKHCQPVFDAIGRATFVAGAEPWQANAVKLCGNFMISSFIECFGEATATLRKADVDPHRFLEIMNALFASPVVANYGGMIADDKYEPVGFALRLGLKDVRLLLETADECASPMPVASIVRDHFLTSIALGQQDSDWASVARISAREAGLL